jgi:hypothetical protein
MAVAIDVCWPDLAWPLPMAWNGLVERAIRAGALLRCCDQPGVVRPAGLQLRLWAESGAPDLSGALGVDPSLLMRLVLVAVVPSRLLGVTGASVRCPWADWNGSLVECLC